MAGTVLRDKGGRPRGEIWDLAELETNLVTKKTKWKCKGCAHGMNGRDVNDVRKHFGIMEGGEPRHRGPCPALANEANTIIINKYTKLKKEYELQQQDRAAQAARGPAQPSIQAALGTAQVTKQRAMSTFAQTLAETGVPYAAIEKFRQAHGELVTAGLPWPTRQKAATWVLEERKRVEDKVQAKPMGKVEKLKKTGMTLLTDGWACDMQKKPLQTYIVRSYDTDFYVVTFDSTGKEKNAEYLADQVLEVLKLLKDRFSINPDRVTDSPSVNRKMWGLLMAQPRAQHIGKGFRASACQTHTGSLLLKDICASVDLLRTTLNTARGVVVSLWSTDQLKGLMKSSLTALPKRYSATRFAMSCALLFSLHVLKPELMTMAAKQEFPANKRLRCPELKPLKPVDRQGWDEDDYAFAQEDLDAMDEDPHGSSDEDEPDDLDGDEDVVDGGGEEDDRTLQKVLLDIQNFWEPLHKCIYTLLPFYQMVRVLDGALGSSKFWYWLGVKLPGHVDDLDFLPAADRMNIKFLIDRRLHWGDSDYSRAAHLLDPEYHSIHSSNWNDKATRELRTALFSIAKD
eukprot:gene2801-3414_t